MTTGFIGLAPAASLAMKIEGTYVASVVLTGLAVVFLALLLLILVFYLFGIVFGDRPKTKKPSVAVQSEIKPLPLENDFTVSKASPPVIEDGISDEIVAVIAAAVAAMSAASGRKLRISSIGTAGKNRNAWAQAGIIDNTRPF